MEKLGNSDNEPIPGFNFSNTEKPAPPLTREDMEDQNYEQYHSIPLSELKKAAEEKLGYRLDIEPAIDHGRLILLGQETTPKNLIEDTRAELMARLIKHGMEEQGIAIGDRFVATSIRANPRTVIYLGIDRKGIKIQQQAGGEPTTYHLDQLYSFRKLE